MAESIPKKLQANLEEFETDEEIVDVDKIEDKISSNVTCVSDQIDSVLKIFDTKTCLDMLRGYYEAYNEVVLPEGTECNIYGYENHRREFPHCQGRWFDWISENTLR
ncbi:uncharacterized protein LOC131891133 isoform X2 [Tigriopus californicus]|uniref:uncharacterized protein LOC131891133 isoform X2 n=1 Tax=Tigriopus californicus TaxID=6832 RepID=UPI0027DA90A9|nr:uncharacterized protein LOC131891133 isoform X2 [Tigriopus californicus]